MCYLAVTVYFLFFVFFVFYLVQRQEKNLNPFKASIPKVQGE